MNRQKCSACGLVNSGNDELCRRCGKSLAVDANQDEATPVEKPLKRSLGKRLVWIASATLVLLFVFYLSLLLTSDDLSYDRKQTVESAIAILRQKGFAREAFILSHLAKYRSSDNWLNRYVGHHDAYAAANFPFELVTLYPEFFDVATDDTERAAILLHESFHLRGAGEVAALDSAWRGKQRLGWTADKYSSTKVWRNTRELTVMNVPQLFICGTDGHSDCFE